MPLAFPPTEASFPSPVREAYFGSTPSTTQRAFQSPYLWPRSMRAFLPSSLFSNLFHASMFGNLMMTTLLGGFSPSNPVVLFIPPAIYCPPDSLIPGWVLGKNSLV